MGRSDLPRSCQRAAPRRREEQTTTEVESRRSFPGAVPLIPLRALRRRTAFCCLRTLDLCMTCLAPAAQIARARGSCCHPRRGGIEGAGRVRNRSPAVFCLLLHLYYRLDHAGFRPGIAVEDTGQFVETCAVGNPRPRVDLAGFDQSDDFREVLRKGVAAA